MDKKTDRKIVVFESDDWGAIRVPSKEVSIALQNQGYAMNSRPYERFDTLESDDDLLALSDVLLKYTDKNGNHPIFTLNYLSANPNFEKIAANKFLYYEFETIVDTYTRYTNSMNVMSIVKRGIDKGIFMPQCHGREHFNILKWMDLLRSGDSDTVTAFQHKMCGIFPKERPSDGNKCMAAFGSIENKSSVAKTIEQAINLFTELWGFSSQTFVAPCYTWDPYVESILAQCGVKLIQTSRVQRLPDGRKKFHYSGEKSSNIGIVYSVRNCSFEPSLNSKDTVAESVIRQIRSAFESKKVAVISTHRINWVSGLSPENRDTNIKLLDNLLARLCDDYQDIEFVSSDKLVDIYEA
jgi:hypothetical protein